MSDTQAESIPIASIAAAVTQEWSVTPCRSYDGAYIEHQGRTVFLADLAPMTLGQHRGVYAHTWERPAQEAPDAGESRLFPSLAEALNWAAQLCDVAPAELTDADFEAAQKATEVIGCGPYARAMGYTAAFESAIADLGDGQMIGDGVMATLAHYWGGTRGRSGVLWSLATGGYVERHHVIADLNAILRNGLEAPHVRMDASDKQALQAMLNWAWHRAPVN